MFHRWLSARQVITSPGPSSLCPVASALSEPIQQSLGSESRKARGGEGLAMELAVLPSQHLSRRRDCHLTDIRLFIHIETPTKGRGGYSRMTVSSMAGQHLSHVVDEGAFGCAAKVAAAKDDVGAVAWAWRVGSAVEHHRACRH